MRTMNTPSLSALCVGMALMTATLAAENTAAQDDATAWDAGTTARAVETMNAAAHQFLASLSEKQRAVAQYPFESDQRFDLRLAPMPS